MTTLVSVLLTFLIAALVARLLRGVVRRVAARRADDSERRLHLHAKAGALIRIITVLLFTLATLVTLSLVLHEFNVRVPMWTPNQIGNWLIVGGVRVMLIVVTAMMVTRLAHLAIENTIQGLGHRDQADAEWQRRASTLAAIMTRLSTVAVGFVAILLVLEELTIDVMPILTGAGIAGLAIGFGAQNLVRDAISGFFIILEDQVRIGDVARINKVTGRVENINLRTIVLRDAEGAVQVFPNGTITALANLSKHFAYALVDVRVSYREDIDQVLQTLREVGDTMRRDPDWAGFVMEPLELNGVESLRDGYAVVRMRFKTPPLAHTLVASELRRRVMIAFVDKKIRPFVR